MASTMAIEVQTGEKRFTAYIASLARALGNADRVQPFQDYCTGLLMP
jgi:SRSO17 transposase